MLLLRAEAGTRPGGRGTFLCFAKETYPKERRPCSLRPFASLRATCGARSWGAPWNSLRAGALRSNNHGESDHEAGVSCGTPATPRPALLGAARRGGNAPTALRAIAALGLDGAGASRCERGAERSDGPRGLRSSNPLLAAPAAGCLRGGMRAFARMLRHLTRRVCPNGAAQQRSELRGAPRKHPDAGVPRKGPQTVGRASLPPFLSRTRKEVARRGESRPPPAAKACR